MTVDFTPFRLVPFRREEHEAGLIALVAACYAEYGQEIELDTLDADLTAVPAAYPPPACAFRVLLDGKRVVGSVAVKGAVPDAGPDAGPEGAELKRVFLDRGYRGRGLGKKLSLWAFAWARERGARTMTIWSDALYGTAHRLYRSLGALDTGRRRRLGGINEVEEIRFVMDLE